MMDALAGWQTDMHRFFVPPHCIDGDRATLPQDAAHQIARVLRLQNGDTIAVMDDSGAEYTVRLDILTPHQAAGAITHRAHGKGEPAVRITLYQGMLKADRFEYVLQKGTELGISRFVPVICERTVARGAPSATRIRRWQRIICEAAEQAGRTRLPILADPVPFAAVCERIVQPALLAWESERTTGIRTALQHIAPQAAAAARIGIVIGPEGGITDAEASRAASAGIPSVSLGSRILRAETAGIIAAAAVLYELGELG